MSDNDPARLAQQLADLRARLTRLEALAEEQTADLDTMRERLAAALADLPVVNAYGTPGAGEQSEPEQPGGGEQESEGPLFILLLDDYAEELERLSIWVHHILVPFYITEPAPLSPWCPTWWEHPEALARLHALWLAWQELTTPTVGGFTGPATWHRDYLDPALAALRSPDGPLSGCTTDPRHPTHRPAERAPIGTP